MIKITFIVTLDEGVTPHGAVAIAEEVKEMIESNDEEEDIKSVVYIIEDNN